MDRKISMAILIAIFSSLVYALWTILSSILMSFENVSVIPILLVVMSSGAFFSFLLTFLQGGFKTYKGKDIRFPIITGILYGFGNIILYSILGNNRLPLVSALLYSNIIIFSILVSFSSGKKPNVKYFIGTIISVIGLTLLEIHSNFNNFNLNFQIIVLSIIMIFFYGFASFFQYESTKTKINFGENMFFIFIFEIVVMFPFLLIKIQTSWFGNTGFQLIEIAIVTGFILFLALFLDLKSYSFVNKLAPKYINIVNILTNIELVWIVIYSYLFLHLPTPPAIYDFVIIIIGIIIISIS